MICRILWLSQTGTSPQQRKGYIGVCHHLIKGLDISVGRVLHGLVKAEVTVVANPVLVKYISY